MKYAPELLDSAGKRDPKQSTERLALEKAIRECHVIYISSPKPGAVLPAVEKHQVHDLLQLAAKGATLTLGEAEEFCEWRGMSRIFVSKEKTLSFDINLPPMRERELGVNARILDFARKTYR